MTKLSELLQSQKSNSNVVVLTCATDYTLGLHNLIQSLKRYDYVFKVVKFGAKWQGFRTKMEAYAEASALESPDTIVVCIDAYDALCCRHSTEFVAAFEAFQKPLVIGVERSCHWWSNCGAIGRWWKSRRAKGLEGATSAGEFLNSGVVAGRAWAVSLAYKWMLMHGFEDDQVGMTSFVNNHPKHVEMDLQAQLISNSNVHTGHLLSADQREGRGAFFLHFPSLKHFPMAYPYRQVVKQHSGALGIAISDYSPNRGWMFLLIALFALVAYVSFWIGRHKL